MSLYFYQATADFADALGVVDAVANSLLTPDASMPANLPRTAAISCGTVVLLSGYFENFLRDVIQEVITDVNGLKKATALIPHEIRLTHFQSGARALHAAVVNDKKSGAGMPQSEDLSRRLGSLAFPHDAELAWESFSDTRANPGPDTVRDILKGLLIEKSWSEINALSAMHGQLNLFLSSFMAIRNVCAHTGTHTTPPTGNDILDYTERFRALAECIDFLIRFQFEAVFRHW